MSTVLYNYQSAEHGFGVIVEVDTPKVDDIPITLGVGDDIPDAEDKAMYLTEDAAIATADALYEAAGRKAPSQLVKASELGANDALIRIAELHNLRVRFRYAKSDSSPVETRTFVPKALMVMEDHTTFIGVDEDRGGFRSFRTDRIKGIVEVVA